MDGNERRATGARIRYTRHSARLALSAFFGRVSRVREHNACRHNPMAGEFIKPSNLGVLASASPLYPLRLWRGYIDPCAALLALDHRKNILGSDRFPNREALGCLCRLCSSVSSLRLIFRLLNRSNSRGCHQAGRPPSIMKVAAVTYEASSEASQSIG